MHNPSLCFKHAWKETPFCGIASSSRSAAQSEASPFSGVGKRLLRHRWTKVPFAFIITQASKFFCQSCLLEFGHTFSGTSLERPNCSGFCFCDKMNGGGPNQTPLFPRNFSNVFALASPTDLVKKWRVGFEATVSQTHKLEVKMLLHCFLALDTLIENYQASRTYWNCRYVCSNNCYCFAV